MDHNYAATGISPLDLTHHDTCPFPTHVATMASLEAKVYGLEQWQTRQNGTLQYFDIKLDGLIEVVHRVDKAVSMGLLFKTDAPPNTKWGAAWRVIEKNAPGILIGLGLAAFASGGKLWEFVSKLF